MGMDYVIVDFHLHQKSIAKKGRENGVCGMETVEKVVFVYLILGKISYTTWALKIWIFGGLL